MTAPKVYISYSCGSAEDKAWVTALAERLERDGIAVILDDWHLVPGASITKWQEHAIREADAALVVVSRRYLERWSGGTFGKGEGGVGVDRRALELRQRDDGFRVIPVVPPNGDFRSDWPEYLRDRHGVKFNGEVEKNLDSYSKLLKALRGESAATKADQLTRPVAGNRSLDAPIHLQSLVIDHFRRIVSLEFLRGASRKAQQGQWTLLLGDNGAGKTSLLWAIGLALLPPEQELAVLGSLSAPLIHNESGNARVRLMTRGGQFVFLIAKDIGSQRELIRPKSPGADFMVFAYGSARGSAFGGPERAVELDRPLDAVGTLFGLGTYLIHAETWLKGLDHSASKSKPRSTAHKVFETVRQTLIKVLPGVDDIVVTAEQVRFRGPAVGDCRISSLSDGYATTMGWVVDLMARWIHEQQRLGLPIKPGFNEKMTGLVLIDELDLHLHPRWQARVVEDLRTAFPKLSFVATTHNPLTLLGAKPGEVHVMRHDEGKLEIVQADLPPGIRADQVLTGAWFGLSSTLDGETQELLAQHRDMLREGVPETNRKRQLLERDLRLRLGSYADTSADRMAQELVAKEMLASHKPLTANDRATIQKKLESVLGAKK